MTGAELLLSALLALMPHSRHTRCLVARAPVIAAHADAAAAETDVPAGVLLAVGFLESHLGCANGSGGNWGAPVDVRHRHTAGTPAHAARALARSFAVCGSWVRGVARFRCGLCVCNPARLVGYDARAAVRLAARLYARAGVPPPAGLAP